MSNAAREHNGAVSPRSTAGIGERLTTQGSALRDAHLEDDPVHAHTAPVQPMRARTMTIGIDDAPFLGDLA
jgi:hypothetical protein